MASHGHTTTRRRACDGKHRYTSRQAALTAMAALLDRTGGATGTMNVYRCHRCTRRTRPTVTYHIGHARGGTWSR